MGFIYSRKGICLQLDLLLSSTEQHRTRWRERTARSLLYKHVGVGGVLSIHRKRARNTDGLEPAIGLSYEVGITSRPCGGIAPCRVCARLGTLRGSLCVAAGDVDDRRTLRGCIYGLIVYILEDLVSRGQCCELGRHRHVASSDNRLWPSSGNNGSHQNSHTKALQG
jgi:hypothetical protein